MKEKVVALFMVMIMLASTGAVVLADSVTSSSGESEVLGDDVGNETNSTANSTFGLLKVVDRLANYTAQLINTSNVSNETLAVYNRANELREKAWEAYRSGNHTETVRYATEAMRLYREVIMALKHSETTGEDGKEIPPGMEMWKLQNAVRVQLEMALRELKYAELIMNRTNVTPEFLAAYNQTKTLVEKVKDDMASGNFTLLKEDFPKLVKARAELHRQIVLTTSKTFKVQAVKAVGRQLKALDELMPKLVRVSMNVGGNLTKELEELKTLRDELRQAMTSGDHEKVVELLREIHKKLLEIKKMLIREKVRDLPWRPPITPNPGRGHGKAHSSERP